MNFLNDLIFMPGAGLQELWSNTLKYWVTPVYFGFIAFMAFKYLRNESLMKLVTFIFVAGIVGVLIFAGDELFGDKNKGITGAATKVAKDINTVVTPVGGAFESIER